MQVVRWLGFQTAMELLRLSNFKKHLDFQVKSGGIPIYTS